MEVVTAIVAVLIIMAVFAGMMISLIRNGRLRGSGLTTTTYMGASYEMLSQDQRKAAQIIVVKPAQSAVTTSPANLMILRRIELQARRSIIPGE